MRQQKQDKHSPCIKISCYDLNVENKENIIGSYINHEYEGKTI